MLTKLLLGIALMAICVAIHATGLIAILRRLQLRLAGRPRSFGASAWRLTRVAAATILLHIAHVLVWAAAYAVGGAMPDFTAASYFSAVTYTTTGYGDLVLPPDWRLVGAVEALTGILMCGLSTGMFFAVFSEIFGFNRRPPSTA